MPTALTVNWQKTMLASLMTPMASPREVGKAKAYLRHLKTVTGVQPQNGAPFRRPMTCSLRKLRSMLDFNILSGLWRQNAVHTYNEIHGVLIYATMWVGLENIMLSKGSRTQTVTRCEVPFAWNVQHRQVLRRRAGGVARGWGREALLTGVGLPSGDESVLELDTGSGSTTRWRSYAPLDCTLRKS